jgi:hypothetical protein
MSEKCQQGTHAPRQFALLFDHLVSAAKRASYSKAERLPPFMESECNPAFCRPGTGTNLVC